MFSPISSATVEKKVLNFSETSHVEIKKMGDGGLLSRGQLSGGLLS
jgi:hypothetical protein